MRLSLANLRRVTSGGEYVAEIDGLRFIAIASVLAYHIWMLTGIALNDWVVPENRIFAVGWNMLAFGERGVPIFFAISGFILGIPFAKDRLLGAKPVSLKQYFLRRVTRLEPPYILSQCVRVVPVMIAKGMTFWQILPHFVAGLLYVHMLIYRTIPLVQLVAWSLEIEIQFYILAPLLSRLFFRKAPAVRWGMLLTFFILHWLLSFRFYGFKPGDLAVGQPLALAYFNMTIIYWSRYFVVGLAMAQLCITEFPSLRNRWVWDALSIPGWALIFALSERWWNLLGPILLMVCFIGAFKGVLAPRFFRIPLVATVGGMCYSIYLTHSLVLQGVYALLNKLVHGFPSYGSRLFIGELFCFPFLIFFGAVYFVLIERPCMDKNWPQKLMAWLREKRRANLSTESAG